VPSKAAAEPRKQKPASKPLAGRGIRLLAVVFDMFIYFLPVAIAFAITSEREDSSQVTELRVSIWMSAVIVIQVLQAVLLSVRGQSLGKLLVGVRIVDHIDESNPGFLRAFVMRSFLPGLMTIVPCLGYLFGLADVLCIFREDRRCIHDGMAGTKVVAL
jgi:uncharacterized RDD family membrane protein YckC